MNKIIILNLLFILNFKAFANDITDVIDDSLEAIKSLENQDFDTGIEVKINSNPSSNKVDDVPLNQEVEEKQDISSDQINIEPNKNDIENVENATEEKIINQEATNENSNQLNNNSAQETEIDSTEEKIIKEADETNQANSEDLTKEKLLDSVLKDNIDREQKKAEFFKIIKNSSLFHTQEQILRLNQALKAISEGRDYNIDELDSVEVDDTIAEVKSTSMNFYLNSIIYRSKRDWVIWINGNKITPLDNKSDLKLVEINKNYVRFSWVTGYEKFVTTVNNAIMADLIPDNTFVKVTDGIAKIDFLLEPNQSFFISNNIQVIEGRRSNEK